MNNCKDKGRKGLHFSQKKGGKLGRISQHMGISRNLISYPSATFEEFIEILNRILTDDQLGLKI
jgi:hypothetical protein